MVFTTFTGGSWHPALIGLVGIVSCIFIFLCYFILIKRIISAFYSPFFRVQSQQTLLNDNNSSVYSSVRYQTRGLDIAILRSLPVIQFRNSYRSSCAGCAICSREFQEGEWIRLLPDCAHVFHVSCTDSWFQTRSTCPLCQSNVVYYSSGQDEHSVSMVAVMEILRREDIHRQPSGGYNVVETEVTQVWHVPVRSDRF